MIHDNMPNRVFKISELTRLIASQLVLISQKSTVNLACACRCLEEPVLSTLWETQSVLHTLLEVLPEETWDFEYLEKHVFRIVGDPAPEDWNRVPRYASWMRQVSVDDFMATGEDTFNKLRLNSPSGGWFPALEDLYWFITESNLSYADLFFSPHLKTISIVAWWSRKNSDVPLGILSTLASTISSLPTSSLQRILVGTDHRAIPWAYFKDSLSSVILRCGPSFTECKSSVPLSDAAVNHLIHLPHFRAWRIHSPPPNYSTASLPLTFPPLKELTLGGDAACGWLSLFRRFEDGVFTAQGVIPLSKVEESLKILNIGGFSVPIIDASFVPPIQRFRNLVRLNVEAYCHDEVDVGQCTFKLKNDDVTEFAMALAQLESLLLGHACFENTCSTTVTCLLPISVYCTKLEKLEIHFNTTNIVDDFKNTSEDPRSQELRSRPRCPLTGLDIYWTPLNLDEPGFDTVARGMIDIFPSLTRCGGFDKNWNKLSRRIAALQEE